MEFAIKNKEVILRMYRDGSSSYEIAKVLNTYPNKILRSLAYLGEEKRDYSEAQKIALEQGRSKHPTEGKKLDEKHKLKIGKSRSKSWSKISDEERERLSEQSRQNWESLPESKKNEIRDKSIEAIRRAGKEGSKTEKHLKKKLEAAGYRVDFHKTNLVMNSNLEVDLFLPGLKTAIEIDGPSHFFPIWGEEKFQKQVAADIIKQGILLDNGYVILRVKQIYKHVSITRMNELTARILQEIKKIEDSFPEEGNRLIEIEVGNE